MLMLGAIGLGLVWGWVCARLLYHARWDVAARVLLGLAALGLVVFRLGAARATVAFAIATVAAALICLAWVRALERRYASMR